MANTSLQVLTQAQQDMIVMLLKGENITDIAKKLEVNRQTIYNWMNRDYVKAELDRRRRDLVSQGNNVILRDLTTYIDNIKYLASDMSDKRVALAANQYLINRIYGTPTAVVEMSADADNTAVEVSKIEVALSKLRMNNRK